MVKNSALFVYLSQNVKLVRSSEANRKFSAWQLRKAPCCKNFFIYFSYLLKKFFLSHERELPPGFFGPSKS